MSCVSIPAVCSSKAFFCAASATPLPVTYNSNARCHLFHRAARLSVSAQSNVGKAFTSILVAKYNVYNRIISDQKQDVNQIHHYNPLIPDKPHTHALRDQKVIRSIRDQLVIKQ